jgi:hypothetical protein
MKDANAVKTARVLFDTPFGERPDGEDCEEVHKVYLTLANPKAARQLVGKKPELEEYNPKHKASDAASVDN